MAANTDLVPMVLTRDANGEPRRVEMVPAERRRRIELFEEVDFAELLGDDVVYRGASLEQRSSDDCDVGFVVHVGEDVDEERLAALPTEVSDVPVRYERQERFELQG